MGQTASTTNNTSNNTKEGANAQKPSEPAVHHTNPQLMKSALSSGSNIPDGCPMHKAKAEEAAKSAPSNGCPMHAEREGQIPKDVNPNNMVI